ncbi:protein-disulfide reductase DsbD domain-containing protein [Futiania mangrovi]|uniref:Thiol:disulfide interchange protein DsbD N-terminal domain-containing protein n=1 Tax=Futiania mangrovi TaxID=2959716 RepID=A0A9J6PLS9_9PROT|nr:protein-disulfide reductase DsbD domain-containing protein [Futiania mangrovii]MCP1337599.1 hypothetical protein [Futiania mangrovii]
MCAAALCFGAASAQEGPVSGAWSDGVHAGLRLIAADAGLGEDGAVMAGIEVRLAPGWKTYWRDPGAAGIAPEFDWSASANVGRVEVLWPVPQRFDTAGLPSMGYAGDVIVPVRVTAADPRKPVELKLAAAFGVCSDLCLLEEASAALTVPPGRDTPSAHWTALLLAETAVPRDGAAAGLSATAVPADGGLHVTVAGPGAEDVSDLFVEGKGDRVYGVPLRLSAMPGESVWRVPVRTGGPPVPGTPLRFTLAAPEGQRGGHVLEVTVGPQS